MSKSKNILIFLFVFSLVYPSSITEYSIGISDKLGYIGLLNKSWITEKESGESFWVAGGIGFAGAYGYGHKHYFLKDSFSTYFSLTGFGYYVLGIGVGISGAVIATFGSELSLLEWKDKELILQLGILSMFDVIRWENMTLGADNGPGEVMPSFSLKVNFIK